MQPSARASSLTIVPFRTGGRPTDELRTPGTGCSEHVDYIDAGAGAVDDGQELWLLYDAVAPCGLGEVEARMDAWFVDEAGDEPVPGIVELPVPWSRMERRERGDVGLVPVSAASSTRGRFTAALPRQALRRAAERGAFSFVHCYHRRLRVRLSLVAGGRTVASDETTVEIFDLGRAGSLYRRIMERLVVPDARAQARAQGLDELGAEYHPWFPVLTIGTDKARRYLDAIRCDLDQHSTHFSDPRWLLRVGTYLELMTCLGIAWAVRDEHPDILDADEWQAVEHGPGFARMRPRLAIERWRAAWQRRHVASPWLRWHRALGGLRNLLRKRDATLEFLEIHHEDLKVAMELAGPNFEHAQQTWHRVFQDAERAVLACSDRAFPELGGLPRPVRELVRWRRCGELVGGVRLPAELTATFGDQDGLYGSACRHYRASMNHVATWARERRLIDFPGVECIPREVSLIEARC
jgi:hypothetical protein